MPRSSSRSSSQDSYRDNKKNKKKNRTKQRNSSEESKKSKDKKENKEKKDNRHGLSQTKAKDEFKKKKKHEEEKRLDKNDHKNRQKSKEKEQQKCFTHIVSNDQNQENNLISFEKGKNSKDEERKSPIKDANLGQKGNLNEISASSTTKLVLSKFLTNEEQQLLGYGLHYLDEEVKKFCVKNNIKIENSKIKVSLQKEENNKEEKLMDILNNLRLILDEYSIFSFEFWKEASNFTLKMFEDILDTALDNPNDFKTHEMHLQKGESIKWQLDNSSSPLKCIFAGKNNEVKAWKRFLHCFNKLIISEWIPGFYKEAVINSENEDTSILEKLHSFYNINSDLKEGIVYLNYIKNKVAAKELDNIRGRINKKEEIKEQPDNIEKPKEDNKQRTNGKESGDKINKNDNQKNNSKDKSNKKDNNKSSKDKEKNKKKNTYDSEDYSESDDDSKNKKRFKSKKGKENDSSSDS